MLWPPVPILRSTQLRHQICEWMNRWWFQPPAVERPTSFSSYQLRPQTLWTRGKPSHTGPIQILDPESREHRKGWFEAPRFQVSCHTATDNRNNAQYLSGTLLLLRQTPATPIMLHILWISHLGPSRAHRSKAAKVFCGRPCGSKLEMKILWFYQFI